jgi:small subunit ribosomal protein S17
VEAQAGDTVVIEECRPLSKTKSWKVARLVERARPE